MSLDNKIKDLIKEERWKSWQNINKIHILEVEEPTAVIRRQVKDKNVANDAERSKLSIRQDPDDPLSDITDYGKVALKVNNIWTNNLTQLLNFQAGKQLATRIGSQIAQQVDLDAAEATKIALLIMRATLEELDELSSTQVEKEMENLLSKTRS